MITRMQKSVQKIISKEEESLRKILQKTISKNKKILMLLTEKLEQLKIDVFGIEEEYAQRVGRLYRKDSLLDLEIIRFQKINDHMDKGMSYEDAVLAVDDLQHVEQYEDISEYIDMPSSAENTVKEGDDIRKLWKKLVHKFHPDLAKNSEEREKRETTMKKINIAYANKDYDTLKTMQEKELVEDIAIEEATMDRLEKLYVDIQNAIVRSREQMRELRRSEWFSWIKKSREERDVLFAEMEKKIAEDVTIKEVMLRSLKRKYNNL